MTNALSRAHSGASRLENLTKIEMQSNGQGRIQTSDEKQQSEPNQSGTKHAKSTKVYEISYWKKLDDGPVWLIEFRSYSRCTTNASQAQRRWSNCWLFKGGLHFTTKIGIQDMHAVKNRPEEQKKHTRFNQSSERICKVYEIGNRTEEAL